MDEFINTFHIDWKLMIAQAINFGLVFCVFYLMAAKPLRKLVTQRQAEISTGLMDAKEAKELLQKATLEYQENVNNLRKMAIDKEKDLALELEKLRAQNLEKIKTDNEEWNKKRLEQMEIDKKTIIESAKNEIISLAMLAAEKIMGEKNKKEE